MYWGYQQRSHGWQAFVEAMKNLSATAIPPRVCIEAHSHIDHVIPWLERLEQLKDLRTRLAALRRRVQMLLVLRLREPLSHYISYFLWTVVERQARAPKRFGSSFEDWARTVPNLQTELLLSSKHAFAASFAPLGHRDLTEWRLRWRTANQTAERRALALRVVRSFDLLGTTERFNEANLLIARRLNWSTLDAAAPAPHLQSAPQAAETCANRRVSVTPKMWWCRVPGRDPLMEKKRVHARVCPDMQKCAALVRSIAPVDHELYAIAKAAIERDVAEAGESFAQGLKELKRLTKSKNELADLAGRTRPNRCTWRAMKPYLIGGPALELNNRRLVMAAAPNFSSPADGACIPGDDATMRAVWSEHRFGGRVAPGWPASNLVPIGTPRYKSLPNRYFAFGGGKAGGKARGIKAKAGGGHGDANGKIVYGAPPYREHKRMLRRPATTRLLKARRDAEGGSKTPSPSLFG